MNQNQPLTSLIGTPEVKISLTTETVVKFFGAMVAAATLIIIVNAIFRKK